MPYIDERVSFMRHKRSACEIGLSDSKNVGPNPKSSVASVAATYSVIFLRLSSFVNISMDKKNKDVKYPRV